MNDYLTTGAWIGIAVALLALAAVSILNYIADRRENRARDRWIARLRAMADEEVSNRPRVAAMTEPLPSLNQKGSQ